MLYRNSLPTRGWGESLNKLLDPDGPEGFPAPHYVVYIFIILCSIII